VPPQAPKEHDFPLLESAWAVSLLAVPVWLARIVLGLLSQGIIVWEVLLLDAVLVGIHGRSLYLLRRAQGEEFAQRKYYSSLLVGPAVLAAFLLCRDIAWSM